MTRAQDAFAVHHQADAGIAALRLGDAVSFREWPNAAVPRAAAGVYTIWRDTQLIYVGMSGNLFDRLRSHASGRRAGDQFCVYVCDRLVVPRLAPSELEELGAGRLSLDATTRDFIKACLSFRFMVTRDAAEARRIEQQLRCGAADFGTPFLNPGSGLLET
jgi:hypothetical protein